MLRGNSLHAVLAAVTVTLIISTPLPASNDDFRQWLQQEQGAFQEYKDRRDREFTAFLKTQWKEMELLKGFKRDTKPKPVEIPVARPVHAKPVEPKPETVPVIAPTPLATTPVPVIEKQKPEPPVRAVKPVSPPAPVAIRKGKKLVVNYFGSSLVFYYDPKFKTGLPRKINKNAISDFWSALSLADYDQLIGQINDTAKALRLNDWAYAVLSNGIAQQIYPASQNSQALFTWFVMTKAGYRARIAYDSSKVYLLVPSHQQLYSVPYFTFDSVRYYAVRFDGSDQSLGRVYTYDGNYPGAEKKLNMQLLDEMVVETRKQSRQLVFSFEGRNYTINADYYNERVDFLNTYPQLDLEWYFRSKVSTTASNALLDQLRAHIKGMEEQQAVNFLLRFVQTSLKYRTDEAQFGRENYLFPEETLHYPYSDCEDRSVLFAWLVKSLLGLDVVGLDYPGHVATAVYFSKQVNGDTVTYKGKRYVVADPTYINAVAGMTMPDYRNISPKVIETR